ncbi:hypothetical protein [Streptomyces sp. NPDC101145]|uniref:hypothetical protein n=1 Tax=Streptomyces sp. NPDC101145 TaxID=3366112 RepID=UPI0037F75FDC
MAQAEAGAAGIDPSDLYAAAISWWSASITPAVSVSSWLEAPMTVWMPLVRPHGCAGEPIEHLLGHLHDELSRLATRRTVINEQKFGAAARDARRADNTGAGTPVFLLTGSPFTSGRSGSAINTAMEGQIRMAWDGRHTLPTRGVGRYRATRKPVPPHVGVTWDVSIRDWRGFLSTDAATYSRVLHFVRRAAPVAHRVDSASGDWREALAAAYAWAFNTRPVLTYTTRAALQWDMVRAAEAEWDTVLPEPHADFFVRVGDHVSRIAGTLAATERTAIHSVHIQAAWTLVRRAVLDTARLIAMDQSTVDRLIRALDDGLGSIPGPEEDAPPLLPNAPEAGHWGADGKKRHLRGPAAGR